MRRIEIYRRFSDLDPLGHVNNVAYHDYLQEARMGLIGELESVMMYSTKEVPQFDANNWSGAFLRLGEHAGNSGLAAAVWRGISHEIQREIVTLSHDLVCSSMYGSTLSRNDCVEEVVTSKT